MISRATEASVCLQNNNLCYFHFVKNLIILLFTFTFVLSCAARDYTYYMNYSEEDLCVDYLILPDFNIHQESRKKAINVRGIDCNKYIDLVRLKLEKEKRDSEIFEDDTVVCTKIGNTVICQ